MDAPVLVALMTPPVGTVPTSEASNEMVAAVALTWLLPAPSPSARVWLVAFSVTSGKVARRPPTIRLPLKLSVLISYPDAGAAPAFIKISEVPPFASMVRDATFAPVGATNPRKELLSVPGKMRDGDVRLLVLGVGGVGPPPPKNGVVGFA